MKKPIAIVALLFAPAAAVASCSNGDDNTTTTPPNDASLTDVFVTDAAGDAPIVFDGALLDAARDADAASLGDTSLLDAAALSDGQIVGVVEAANSGEIEEALLATGGVDGLFDGGLDGGLEAGLLAATGFDAGTARSTTPAVLSFADMMIVDHANSNVAVQSFGIASQSSPVQTTLQSGVQTTLGQLSPLSGGAFDVAYAQSQVTAHQTVRDIVQNQLIPAAQNAQLKSFLQNTLLPTVQSHLAAAQTLLSQLTDGGVVDAGGGG
jgi:putative membrane protein